MVTNVFGYLEQAASFYGQQPAYEDAEEAITFTELRDRAKALGMFIEKQGITRGTIAVFMPKSVAMITSFFEGVPKVTK